jgi:hypothetical protein
VREEKHHLVVPIVSRKRPTVEAILSHFEVGAGIVPGGGPMARLPRLMGRGRALEVPLGADDVPGDLAERYGYVNRALPDVELDEFVDALATRIASFDKRAISETKRFADVASLPPDYEIAPEWDVCFASIMRPAAQEKIKKFMEQGFTSRVMWKTVWDITSANSAAKHFKQRESTCHTMPQLSASGFRMGMQAEDSFQYLGLRSSSAH